MAGHLGGYIRYFQPCTVDPYRSICENHVKPALWSVKLEQLTAPQSRQFYSQLQRDKELSAKTVKNIHRTLHKVLNQAVKIGSICHDPANARDLPEMYRKGSPLWNRSKFPNSLKRSTDTSMNFFTW